jgi:AcrR family transcriptional regulator
MSSPEMETTETTELTDAPDTRERILRETLRLMEQRRGRGVRVEDIARAAGVSRQAVYLHFGSRTELLVATARYLDERLRLSERIQRVFAAPSGQERLDGYMAFWASYIPEIYGLAKALLTQRDTDEAAAAAWADRMAAMYQGCRMAIRCVEQEGQLAPEWTGDAAADFFWAALSIETWEHLTIERGWTQTQYLDRMRQVVKRALLQ